VGARMGVWLRGSIIGASPYQMLWYWRTSSPRCCNRGNGASSVGRSTIAVMAGVRWIRLVWVLAGAVDDGAQCSGVGSGAAAF
jgi:hypothetical protein